MLSSDQLAITINHQALPPLSLFSAKAPQTWGILGANGAGKTTLLHTLGGLHQHYTGHITLHGKALSDYSPKQLARIVGLLLQDNQFEFSISVYNAIILGNFAKQPLWHTITEQQQQHAQHLLDTFDLKTLQNRCITKLSGGERQRVNLAILAMQQPEIYLLDEPTNHLDIRHKIAALNYFTRLNKLIIMSLHDVNIANRYCSHIILLYPDEIISGETKEVLTIENLTRLYQTPFHYYTECDMFLASGESV